MEGKITCPDCKRSVPLGMLCHHDGSLSITEPMEDQRPIAICAAALDEAHGFARDVKQGPRWLQEHERERLGRDLEAHAQRLETLYRNICELVGELRAAKGSSK